MHMPRQSRSSGGGERLFFALRPDDATRRAIIEAVQSIRRERATRGLWVEPHAYHLTLQFLGAIREWPQSFPDQACTAAGELDAAGFDLKLDRLGSFSRVWWLGCGTPPPPLMALWQALGAALARHADWQQPAGFTPHVTILRHAEHPVADAIAAVRWPVRSFALMRSRQVDTGSDYQVIGEWPLRT